MDLFRDNISFSNLLLTRKLIRIDYLTALLQEKNIIIRSLGFEKKNIESFLIKDVLLKNFVLGVNFLEILSLKSLLMMCKRIFQ